MTASSAAAVLVGAIEGLQASSDELAFFRHHRLAGLTLFRRNIPEPWQQLGQLNKTLQANQDAAAPPLLIAIDQEGGRVARIRQAGFPEHGPALDLQGGRSDTAALAAIAAYGQTLGAALASVGVNANFAPCSDVWTRDSNTAIGDRAFAREARSAATRAGAFLRGMQGAGVLGCLKHFPGQGDAGADTHEQGTVIDRSLAELEARELIPFRALLAEAPMVMVAHCIYPQLSAKEASRAPEIMDTLLRQRLGYQGVIVTDDMNMGAIPQSDQAWESALIEAILAGADMLLVCRHLERMERAVTALHHEAKKSPAFAARLDQAATRVLHLRRRLKVSTTV